MDHTEFRAALRDLKLPQRQLAARLGLAVSTVSHWATGKAPVPQYAIAYLTLLRQQTAAA